MISESKRNSIDTSSGSLTDIVCDEVGTPKAAYWDGSRDELGRDVATIEALNRQKMLVLEVDGNHVRIRGRDRVGVLLLPSGRRVIIRTKIPGIVLLEWLAFLGEFPDLRTWTSAGNISDSGSIQVELARLFLSEMERLTRIHLRKGFVQFVEESQRVRGRILGQSLAQRPWRLPSIPQVVRGRSLDTPANIMLALALDKLLLFLPDRQTEAARRHFASTERESFERLRSEWATISRKNEDRHTLVAITQAATPDGYRNACQIARLILLGATLDPQSGMGGQAFTISLARIWEQAVTQMCRDLEPQTQWRVETRSKCVRRWDDAHGPDDRYRSLIADTILRRGTDRWVLDAKYKCGYGDESRNDRFQMCAYILAFGATRATLVYPVASTSLETRRKLLSISSLGQQVVVDSIAINMAAGPDATKESLRHIMLKN
jgi:5-methylcytosine-specific restriction endonuclease McrBC regulatory subunit McrC